MSDAWPRLLRAVRFEREPFIWMDFNDRATGDGFFLVIITRFLVFLSIFGFGSLRNLINFRFFEVLLLSLLGGLVFWLVYSAISYAVVQYLLQGRVGFPTVLRIAGYAYPTTLVAIFTVQVFGGGPLSFFLGWLWFLAVVAKGLQYTADISIEQGVIASLGGLVGTVIASSILGLPL